jgi:hypothetical protein
MRIGSISQVEGQPGDSAFMRAGRFAQAFEIDDLLRSNPSRDCEKPKKTAIGNRWLSSSNCFVV